MASHGQGAVDRADGDDFGTKEISQESQGGVFLACVHVRVHSPRVQRDCDLAAGIARIRCLPGGWHQMALFVRCRLAWAAAPGGEDVASLTPASPADLPPLGELIVDDPFWRYLAGLAREGVAHLRVWTTVTVPPGHLAIVTETGSGASVTESAGLIWAELARRYGPSVVLLEHRLAPEFGEGKEILDLVRIGASGSPHWTRIWPTPEENPRHARLELWMATGGHQIVGKPASWFDFCEDEDD